MPIKVLSIAAVLLALSIPLPAQTPKPAEEVFKNIKVLQGTPSDSFNQGMHLISGALGVGCEYCHNTMDFASDAIKKKDIARQMITMTAGLNQRAFKGQQVVTCYTCHQGNPAPRNTPVLPMAEATAEKQAQRGLPTVNQVLEKYVAALGGEQNLRKITSRVITARQDIPTGPGGVTPTPAQIEISQKGGLLLRSAKTKEATLWNGVDAKGAWTQDGRGRVNPAIDLEQVRERREADLYEPLDLAKDYPDLKVEGEEKIGAKDVYAVTGTFAPGATLRLYFDTQSGLLVRRYTVVPTAAGNSPFQIDYDEYRDSGNGVKYPYRLSMTPAGPRTELTTHSTIQIDRIQENIALDDGRFARPASKDAPAR